MLPDYRENQSVYDYTDPQHLQLLLDVRPVRLTRRQFFYNRYIKRLFDFCAALVLLVLLSPLLGILAALLFIESGSPVFFRQLRVGLAGKSFLIYKFRTMYQSAPAEMSTLDFQDSESHITRLGKILRRTSLDELPQLLNIIKGEMSLIGPRPLIRSEQDMDYLRLQNGVYQVRPGITGLAQVMGRDMMTVEEKIGYDRSYVETLGPRSDFRIFLQTFRTVLKKDDVAF